MSLDPAATEAEWSLRVAAPKPRRRWRSIEPTQNSLLFVAGAHQTTYDLLVRNLAWHLAQGRFSILIVVTSGFGRGPDMESRMESIIDLIRSFGFFGWILIVAVVGIITQGVVTMYRMKIKHAERMAMIEHGDDPGNVEEAYKSDTLEK